METTLATLPPVNLQYGRQQLLARRLSLFAIGWLSAALAWGLALGVESRLAIFPAALLFTFQLGTLVAAIAICHTRGSTARVPLVVLAACVLLGISSTSMFAAVGGYGDMLMFILLTLYLASTPLFAWSGRAALILVVSTLLPWVLALPFLQFILRPTELAAAIVLGCTACFVTLQWSRRNFRKALGEVVTANACRVVTEASGDIIFAVDEEGRFIYVNAALASLAGRSAGNLVGEPLQAFFSVAGVAGPPHDGQQPREITLWQANTIHGPRLFEVVAWRRQDDHGRLIGSCMVGRDASTYGAKQAPASPAEEHDTAGIALLREPLRRIKDEEVRRLKEEVAHLRRQVRRQDEHPLGATPGGDNDYAAAAESHAPYAFPEHYRRKRQRRKKSIPDVSN